ncbi:hypothetical protein NPX13_g4289 [Xylaria arbuscula]|uniref:Uncharacterized protein n=1 Tax=Xylaria arbuscula TaxID=114810 RepID=A0A9W8TPA2_9PEZI|nr:hypothetical protein NPX13_g4289 [Xylaria arbuscula]
MNYFFDGNGLSREQLQAKAEAAEMTGQFDGDSSNREKAPSKPPKASEGDSCDWRGDAPSPELDDLAHSHDTKNKRAPAPVDACDWRGDKPESQEDDLDQKCKVEKQAKTSGRHDQPVEQADDIQMPIPRLPKVDELPEMLRRSEDNENLAQKPETKQSVEPPARNKGKSERAKRPKKLKAPAEAIGEQSSKSAEGKEDENESPSRDKTYSPWIESLNQMPPSVIEKVESGIKHTIEGAISILTPRAEEKQQSPEPIGEERVKGTTALAPESAAPLPAEMLVPSPTLPPIEELPQDDRLSKKQERERKRAERRARHEAKRNARRQKKEERKEQRRAAKKKKLDEKKSKKAAKRGELPIFLIQGLRPGKTPHHPDCEICKKPAVSEANNRKENSECPACDIKAERQSTQEFLKTANVDLGNLPFVDDGDAILALLRDILRIYRPVGTMSSDVAKEGGKNDVDEDLVKHMCLHVRSFIIGRRKTDVPGHKCNSKCQHSGVGRHGLDGIRDSPPSSDGGQNPLNLTPRSGSSSNSDPSEALRRVRTTYENRYCPEHHPATRYRSLSPHAGTPVPRARTAAAYEPEMPYYPMPSPFDSGHHTGYNVYLHLHPWPSYCQYYSGPPRHSVPLFPRPVPSFWKEQPFDQEAVPPTTSFAETIPSASDLETPRISRDYHLRSRSGSV